MRHNTSDSARFPAIMGIVGGLLYLGSALTSLAAGIGGVSSQSEYWAHVAEAKFLYAMPFWLSGLGSICLVATVQRVSRSVSRSVSGWIQWLGFITSVILVMHALQVFRFAIFNPDRAQWYVEGSQEVRLAIEAARYSLQSDPRIFAFLGLLGLWMISTSAAAFRRPEWSRAWCILGFLTGGLLLLGMAGSIPFENVPLEESFRPRPLRTAGLFAAGFAGPTWFLWYGLQALRRPPEAGHQARHDPSPQ